MTSLRVICGLGSPQQKILATPMVQHIGYSTVYCFTFIIQPESFLNFSSVQLFYFMTSGRLKASHIKTGVKKKVEAAKRYTLRHAGCLHGRFTI